VSSRSLQIPSLHSSSNTRRAIVGLFLRLILTGNSHPWNTVHPTTYRYWLSEDLVIDLIQPLLLRETLFHVYPVWMSKTCQNGADLNAITTAAEEKCMQITTIKQCTLAYVPPSSA
jgi:hypothetical protein